MFCTAVVAAYLATASGLMAALATPPCLFVFAFLVIHSVLEP